MPNADAQIDSLLHELRETRARAEAIFNGRKPAELLRRPAEKRWSAAECVEHLNITNRAYLPRLSEAIRTLREKNLVNHGGFRLQDPTAVLSAFQSIGQEIEEELTAARTFPLDAERIRSPFAESMKYNVYSAFTLIAAHNRRHLWQAGSAL